MARVALTVERTYDDRDQTERIRHLEAQVSALRARIKELEARPALPPGFVGWRELKP